MGMRGGASDTGEIKSWDLKKKLNFGIQPELETCQPCLGPVTCFSYFYSFIHDHSLVVFCSFRGVGNERFELCLHL